MKWYARSFIVASLTILVSSCAAGRHVETEDSQITQLTMTRTIDAAETQFIEDILICPGETIPCSLDLSLDRVGKTNSPVLFRRKIRTTRSYTAEAAKADTAIIQHQVANHHDTTNAKRSWLYKRPYIFLFLIVFSGSLYVAFRLRR